MTPDWVDTRASGKLRREIPRSCRRTIQGGAETGGLIFRDDQAAAAAGALAKGRSCAGAAAKCAQEPGDRRSGGSSGHICYPGNSTEACRRVRGDFYLNDSAENIFAITVEQGGKAWFEFSTTRTSLPSEIGSPLSPRCEPAGSGCIQQGPDRAEWARVREAMIAATRPRGETSNSLLDVLAEWNAYLERHGQQSSVVGQACLMASTA
jgi:hypothetical protein